MPACLLEKGSILSPIDPGNIIIYIQYNLKTCRGILIVSIIGPFQSAMVIRRDIIYAERFCNLNLPGR